MANNRRKKKRKNLFPVIILAVLIVALIVVVILVFKPAKPAKNDVVQAMAEVTMAPVVEPTIEISEAPTIDATPEPTPAPTPEITPAPTRSIARQYDYLPIYSKGAITSRKICITVDDCNQIKNFSKILDMMEAVGGKITIFPIGKNVIREEMKPVLKRAYEMGMEIENHSFSHEPFYRMSDEEMSEEIFRQNLAVSYVLGVNYQMHFMRTRGGDNRNDLRTHLYIADMGYKGMAHWSVTGSGSSMGKIYDALAPGAVYLFHTTDSDVEKIAGLLKFAVQEGYEFVTMNEMFGFPENEVSPLPANVDDIVKPEPFPYEGNYEYKTVKRNDYLYDGYLIQKRLIELKYTNGTADGVYGRGTESAVEAFQKKNGLDDSGKADVETQMVLFSGAAIDANGKLGSTPTPKPPTPTPDPNATPTPYIPPKTPAPRDDGIDWGMFD